MSFYTTDTQASANRTSLVARLVVVVVIAIAIVLVWVSNIYLTNRFTHETRTRSELRLAIYSGNILSELKRTATVPLLLSRDPVLISALNSGDFAATSQRLISLKDEIGAASLVLLDEIGRVVAATDRRDIGSQHRNKPYFVNALRSQDTVFSTTRTEAGGLHFSYSRKLQSGKKGIGVIIVEVGLSKLEEKWAAAGEAIMVTNSEGIVILASKPRWKLRTIEDSLTVKNAPGPLERAISVTSEWIESPADAIARGRAILRLDGKVGFQGWRLTYFTTFASVRERVNGVLAIEIMGFAILVALVFFILSRRAVQQSNIFQRESIELRALNERLSSEIVESQKIQR
ncbi:MAG: cache domain-containing protein, partial [Paracoccaceae bacterium]